MIKRQLLLSMVTIAFIFLNSCNRIEKFENPESQLQSLWEEFSSFWNNFDAEACASFYMEDALNIPPEMPVNYGRESIERFYSWLFSMHLSANYHHQINSVSYFENQAVEFGKFHVEWQRTDGSEWNYKARSLTHWVKDENDNWKIKTFVFNSPPADN
ncbi:MAG: DUF4440 domain-containing protein [Bacteroidetes bacterium]|nr:MAG: DUF4440 domain-containing protein [Bacteroidota bacterium]